MLNRSQIMFGERALFAGAVVIIDGNSSEGLDYLCVRFACDPLRTTMPVLISSLDPISINNKETLQ